MSSVLSSLKIVQAKRIAATVDVAEFRRQKLARKIDEQIALVKEFADGGRGLVTRMKRVVNDGGDSSMVEVQRRARTWWYQSDKGTLCLSIRYGAKVVELVKGRNAIEVGGVAQLGSTLETVKKAVLGGELDSQIAVAAEAVKARFKTK